MRAISQPPPPAATGRVFRRERLVVLAMLFLGGCLNDPHVGGVKGTPSFVRATIPAAGAQNVGKALTISVTFRDDPDLSTVQLRLLPREVSSGVPFQSGRTVTWPDVELFPFSPASVLIIDSPEMPSPHQIHFFPGAETLAFGRFAGEVTAPGRPGGAKGTLVLAIPADEQDFLSDSNMSTIARRQPAAGTLVEFDPSQEEWVYIMRFLEIGTTYVVIAIHDTSGDGRYDVGDDLWGFYRPTAGSGGIVTAQGFDLDSPTPTPNWTTDNDVELGAFIQP